MYVCRVGERETFGPQLKGMVVGGGYMGDNGGEEGGIN